MAALSINVIDLRCSQCGSELAGNEYDRVFFCTGCRIAFEAEAGTLVQLPYLTTRFIPREQGITIHHLPVWMFEIEVIPVHQNSKQSEKASAFFGPGRAFVPGFKMSNKGFYGDPGITLTRHWYFTRIKKTPDALGLEAGRFDRLPSCETPSALAAQFIEPILLSIIDPIVDITGLELKISVQSKALLNAAFRQKGSRIGCLDLSDEYPAHAFSNCIDFSGQK